MRGSVLFQIGGKGLNRRKTKREGSLSTGGKKQIITYSEKISSAPQGRKKKREVLGKERQEKKKRNPISFRQKKKGGIAPAPRVR